MSKTYKGWTNYATWRVNLEVLDGIQFVRDDVFGEDIYGFAGQLKGYVEQLIDEGGDNDIAKWMADAFLQDVNFYEIAEGINEAQELGLKK